MKAAAAGAAEGLLLFRLSPAPVGPTNYPTSASPGCFSQSAFVVENGTQISSRMTPLFGSLPSPALLFSFFRSPPFYIPKVVTSEVTTSASLPFTSLSQPL